MSAIGSPLTEMVDARAPVSRTPSTAVVVPAKLLAPVRINVFEPAWVSDPPPPIVLPIVTLFPVVVSNTNAAASVTSPVPSEPALPSPTWSVPAETVVAP